MKNLFTKKNALYLITDRSISGTGHETVARQALGAGIRTIQLREKTMSGRELYALALSIRKITRKFNAALIINDHVDIALAVDADGVHIGQDDMPLHEARNILGTHKTIGVSTHSLKQAVNAEREGADYIGFGPVYKTATKDAGRPKGINGLIEIKKHIKIPLVAIGGITPENVPLVFQGGADAAAVISGIITGDIRDNVKKYFSAMKNIGSFVNKLKTCK
ncbi:MAG: thiamine phosphate synthase [Nitrospirae bacterium]|nr:thiamine phosphate synthase [Nitrospirota bacterium]